MQRQDLPKQALLQRLDAWHDPARPGRTFLLTTGAAPPLPLPDEVQTAVARSETGAALFHDATESVAVLPPFPIETMRTLPGWDAAPLRALLERERRVGVLLLRLGGYAVGVFQGDALAVSKVGSRFVKGRHKKGGSSSGRFARRRQGQEQALFDKACETLRERLEPHVGSLDHFLLGGDRLTLKAFEKRCAFLAAFDAVRLGRVLNVPDPSQETLEGLPRLLYVSRVFTFGPEDAPGRP